MKGYDRKWPLVDVGNDCSSNKVALQTLRQEEESQTGYMG